MFLYRYGMYSAVLNVFVSERMPKPDCANHEAKSHENFYNRVSFEKCNSGAVVNSSLLRMRTN